MGSLLADTHAAIWYLFGSEELSRIARAALRATVQSGDRIYIASISAVETTYLVEKGRVPAATLDRLSQTIRDPETNLELAPLDMDVAQAVRRISRDLVPDMPDRIIAATALHLNLPLVTRDRRLQAANIQTIW